MCLSQGLWWGKYSNKTAPVDMKDSMVSSAVVTHQAVMISACLCECVLEFCSHAFGFTCPLLLSFQLINIIALPLTHPALVQSFLSKRP